MKKLFLLIFPLFVCMTVFGCESAAVVKLASFSNLTSAGSENYTFRLSFQTDKRYEEEYFDIQVMSSESDLSLSFRREGEGELAINIAEKNVWNSLTSLQATASGLEGREQFDQLKEAVSQIFIFNVSKPCKLTFRVVSGSIAENQQQTGFVIMNTQPISDDFVLNCA